MKRGDRFAAVVQPIARGIDATLGTNVADCPGCKKMQQNLNNGMSLGAAIYERWFKAKTNKGDKMADEIEKKYYTLVVLVEAEDAVEALSKRAEGKVLAVNPQQQKPQIMFGGGVAKSAPTGQVIIKGSGQSA